MRELNTNLRRAKLVLCVIEVNRAKKLLRSFLSIDELSLGDGAGVQDSVSVPLKMKADYHKLKDKHWFTLSFRYFRFESVLTSA